MLDLLNSLNIFPTFHTSDVLPYVKYTDLFPSHKFAELTLIVTEERDEEYYIDQILDAWCCGHGWQYLVWWWSYGQEHNNWLPWAELQDCQAMDDWLALQVHLP